VLRSFLACNGVLADERLKLRAREVGIPAVKEDHLTQTAVWPDQTFARGAFQLKGSIKGIEDQPDSFSLLQQSCPCRSPRLGRTDGKVFGPEILGLLQHISLAAWPASPRHLPAPSAGQP
jgi:hypothetical protein